MKTRTEDESKVSGNELPRHFQCKKCRFDGLKNETNNSRRFNRSKSISPRQPGPDCRISNWRGAVSAALPTRALVGDEAGRHGWTGRRVGGGPPFLRGPVTQHGEGGVTHNGGFITSR